MGAGKLIALLFGSGAAVAKSSYDLRQKANSPVVKAQMEAYHEEFDPYPIKGGYNRVREYDLIHYKIRDDLKAIQQIEEEFRQKGVEEEKLRETAQKGFLYRTSKDYYDQYYTYRDYVLEWARKTLWFSGYMPARASKYKDNRYNVIYTGKRSCYWPLDFTNGIPDQEFRHLLSIADKHSRYTITSIDGGCSPMTRKHLLELEEKDRMEQELFETGSK